MEQTRLNFDRYDGIGNLGLSTRAENALRQNGITTITEVESMSFYDLCNIRGIGLKSAEEIFLAIEDETERGEKNVVGLAGDFSSVSNRVLLRGKGFERFGEAGEKGSLSKDDLNLGIDCLILSQRTRAALLRNNIMTLGDIVGKSACDLRRMRGIGAECVKEIIAAVGLRLKNDVREGELPTISEYITEGNLDGTQDRNYGIFVRYYNNYPNYTFDDVMPEGERLTRQRVQQIIARQMEKVIQMVKSKAVKTDFLRLAEGYAESVTQLDNVIMNEDIYLNGVALIMIAARIIPDKVKIYSDLKLEGKWVVKDIEKTKAALDGVSEILRFDSRKQSLTELADEFSLNTAIIRSLKGIVVDENGMATKSANHVALGRDLPSKISDYMAEIKRPASVAEMAEKLGVGDRKIRAAVLRLSDTKNVGPSMYVSRDERFEGQSVADLAKGYLTAAARPVRLDRLIEYIKVYKSEAEVESIVYILCNPTSIFKPFGNQDRIFLWLKDVKYNKKKRTRTPIIETCRRAIEVFRESPDPMNGNIVSEKIEQKCGESKYNSVNYVLRKLYAEGAIRKYGNGGYYVKSGNFEEIANKIERGE